MCQRPSVAMPTGTISYLSGSSARATATAVTRDTSCSADCPPKRSITRRREPEPVPVMTPFFPNLCDPSRDGALSSRGRESDHLEDGADPEAHDEQATEAVRELHPAAGPPHVAI